MKRAFGIMIIAGFLISALPLHAGASQSFYRQKVMAQNIAQLQQQLSSEDPTGINAATMDFLDAALAAGLNNDKAGLQAAVNSYVADIGQIQADLAIDNATSCLITFGISAGGAAAGMLTELTSGNSVFCMVLNLSNKAADIGIANCKYNICLIDKTSSYTGTKTRDEWVAQQQGLAIYNFVSNAAGVVLCTPAPSAQTYISLFFDLIGIFSAK